MDKYDHIINLPHHVSSKRPQMPMMDRAAQFSPFAALTGYDAAIQETGRLTDEKIELGEEEKSCSGQKTALPMRYDFHSTGNYCYLLQAGCEKIRRHICYGHRKSQTDR